MVTMSPIFLYKFTETQSCLPTQSLYHGAHVFKRRYSIQLYDVFLSNPK